MSRRMAVASLIAAITFTGGGVAAGVGSSHASSGFSPSRQTILRAYRDNDRWCVKQDAPHEKSRLIFRDGLCGGKDLDEFNGEQPIYYSVGQNDHQCVFAVQFQTVVTKSCIDSVWHLFDPLGPPPSR